MNGKNGFRAIHQYKNNKNGHINFNFNEGYIFLAFFCYSKTGDDRLSIEKYYKCNLNKLLLHENFVQFDAFYLHLWTKIV